MDPVPNPLAKEPAPGRKGVRARTRALAPEIAELVERLHRLEPHRAQIVARARARLMDGSLDSESAIRAAAVRFLQGDATETA